MGQLELRLGQGEAAKQRFERVLSIKRKHGHAQGEVSAQVALSTVALTAGDTPGALSYVEAALSVPDTAHLLLPRAPAVTQHGRVLAAAGKVAAAETAFAEALAMRRQMTQPHHVAAVRAWQARLFLESDRLDEARRAAEDVLARAWSASRRLDGVDDPVGVCAAVSEVIDALSLPGAEDVRAVARRHLSTAEIHHGEHKGTQRAEEGEKAGKS
ncbi:MAG: hypothetical protein R2856_24040 [Caldilineaceae bacterium]